jgi:hypothetical protein
MSGERGATIGRAATKLRELVRYWGQFARKRSRAGRADRGKRIAFGDGYRIRWDKNSAAIFRKNKNIAIPGTERQSDIEWVHFYTGNRLYNKQGANRWIWN